MRNVTVPTPDKKILPPCFHVASTSKGTQLGSDSLLSENSSLLHLNYK